MSALFDVEEEPDATDALPPLRGTDRQVPWATKVRAAKFAGIYQFIAELQEVTRRHDTAGRTELAAKQREVLRRAMDRCEALQAETYSGWWLDRRDNTAPELLAGAAAKPGNDLRS